MRKVVPFIALFALLSAGAAVSAQVQRSDLNADPGTDGTASITVPPNNDDEVCDDEELLDTVLDCNVTKVTTDLDSPIPVATFWGTFCDNPLVSAGQTDGTSTPVLNLSSGTNFVTVDLTGNDDPAGVVFTIECPCETCECKVTLGTVGPEGPPGPKGEKGAPGEQGDIGSAGPEGPQGSQGPSGLPGTEGPIGIQGPTGVQGAIGPQGFPGPPGPTGAQGPTGPVGSTVDLQSGTLTVVPPSNFENIGTSEVITFASQFSSVSSRNA